MIIPMLPQLTFVFLTLAGLPPAEEIVDQIERIAVAEPPVLGIDTQIRAATILQPKQPERAHRFLADATSRALTLEDPHTRAHFVIGITEAMSPIDAAEAETLCLLLPPHAAEDPLPHCYNVLFRSRQDWPDAKALYRRAIAAGAFSTPAFRDHLERAVKQHREELAAEFLLLLESYPGKDATPSELQQLTELAQFIRKFEPALASQAAELAKTTKPPKADKSTPEKKKDDERPSTKDLEPDQVIALARKQTPLIQTELLIDLIDKPDLTTPQRISIAYQAVEAANRIPPEVDDRLVALSMLTRRLYEYGDRPKAAVAAQMLADAFAKLYKCDLAACVSFSGDESPGEIIYQFAEYLAEHKIQPADLGLNHKSLEARLLLFDLEESLQGKRRKFGFFF